MKGASFQPMLAYMARGASDGGATAVLTEKFGELQGPQPAQPRVSLASNPIVFPVPCDYKMVQLL